jgi:protein-S-isoprenylcysteine O-methyltransferase Ste14
MLMVYRLGQSFLRLLDSGVYALIGPFAALYIFPQFFMQIEKSLFGAMNIPVPPALDVIGSGLMWAGAALAIWCGALMTLNKWGSVVPFFKPTALVISGPYRFYIN